MRAEAGKMPESLVPPIGNRPGKSDDRFGINSKGSCLFPAGGRRQTGGKFEQLLTNFRKV